MRKVFPVREKEENLKVLAKSPGILGQRKLLPTAREGYVFRTVWQSFVHGGVYPTPAPGSDI